MPRPPVFHTVTRQTEVGNTLVEILNAALVFVDSGCECSRVKAGNKCYIAGDESHAIFLSHGLVEGVIWIASLERCAADWAEIFPQSFLARVRSITLGLGFLAASLSLSRLMFPVRQVRWALLKLRFMYMFALSLIHREINTDCSD